MGELSRPGPVVVRAVGRILRVVGRDGGTDAGTNHGMERGQDAGTDDGIERGQDAGTDAGTNHGMERGPDPDTDGGPGRAAIGRWITSINQKVKCCLLLTLNQLVEDSSTLDVTFQALAHPVRRAILTRLTRDREATVSELAAPFDISLAGISKHLRVLHQAGLVHVEPRGRERRVRLEAGPLEDAEEWIERHRRFWTARLLRLGEVLAEEDEAARAPRGRPPKKERGSA